jgi:hypothetical protein
MTADVRITSSPRCRILTPCTGQSHTIIGTFQHGAWLIGQYSGKDGTIEIKLEPLRILASDSSVANNPYASAKNGIHQLAIADGVVKCEQLHAGFFVAGNPGAVEQTFREQLPALAGSGSAAE